MLRRDDADGDGDATPGAGLSRGSNTDRPTTATAPRSAVHADFTRTESTVERRLAVALRLRERGVRGRARAGTTERTWIETKVSASSQFAVRTHHSRSLERTLPRIRHSLGPSQPFLPLPCLPWQLQPAGRRPSFTRLYNVQPEFSNFSCIVAVRDSLPLIAWPVATNLTQGS